MFLSCSRDDIFLFYDQVEGKVFVRVDLIESQNKSLDQVDPSEFAFVKNFSPNKGHTVMYFVDDSETCTIFNAWFEMNVIKHTSDVVEADEFESGIRAILNLGHTFGHAIEVAQGYGNWLHGEAVSAGMVMAARLSQSMDWLSDKDVKRIIKLIKGAGLPTKPPAITVEKYLELMMLDKKTKDGHINLVLQKSIGEAVLTNTYDPSKLRQVLESSH